jgi:hypothetical protein
MVEKGEYLIFVVVGKGNNVLGFGGWIFRLAVF